ncbi:hypothetical protein X740_15745 [Mesorhizobium sp. LNHC221B00]|uniref:hypothetical protein n=1 Tax=Mesorhizobium sp. LNHC221B00 TaxID=1287233 RepID=UPI0003CEF4CF|nr:hypothetical protein [Mesorhizobium sp. LNHC221B00]ESY79480.1 hypothetical protein X740_15745 [Mesorhizobium sp. LNHC221B00]
MAIDEIADAAFAKVGVERSNRFTRSWFPSGTKHRKASVRRGFFVFGPAQIEAGQKGASRRRLPQGYTFP